MVIPAASMEEVSSENDVYFNLPATQLEMEIRMQLRTAAGTVAAARSKLMVDVPSQTLRQWLGIGVGTSDDEHLSDKAYLCNLAMEAHGYDKILVRPGLISCLPITFTSATPVARVLAKWRDLIGGVMFTVLLTAEQKKLLSARQLSDYCSCLPWLVSEEGGRREC